MGIVQGHDAMATALSWFLYCMAANPNDQVQIFIAYSI